MPNSNGLSTGIGILAAVARQERVRLSERTIAGLQRAKAQGPGRGSPTYRA
jgi:DNA invertase Pin-like site-specific DNA recombinase